MELTYISDYHDIYVANKFLLQFWNVFVYFLLANINKYYHMMLTVSYSGSAYPITPVEPLKATLYDHFGIQYTVDSA